MYVSESVWRMRESGIDIEATANRVIEELASDQQRNARVGAFVLDQSQVAQASSSSCQCTCGTNAQCGGGGSGT